MGCLSAWVYAHPEAFTDITVGNTSCGSDTERHTESSKLGAQNGV